MIVFIMLIGCFMGNFDLNRSFNFIYFGFVGDSVDSGGRRGCGTRFNILEKILSEYGVAIKHGDHLANNEYRPLMSVDLMYRHSNKPKIDGEQSSRWPVKYCFLRNVAMSRSTLNAHEIENIQFDFEQLDVFFGYYKELGKHNETISEMTAFLGDIEKSNDIEEDPNERTAIFIKNFVYLLDSELKKKSVSLCNELKIGNHFLMKSSHYIITAIALKLISEISKKKPPSESGVKFLYDELFLFYVELMGKDILSKRTEELFYRLQAFIDMFIIGVCYNKQQQAARKEYISGIVKSALNECVNLKVECVREDVRQFVDEHGNMFFEYVSNNRFKMYAGKKWYNELYHLAEKDKEYFGFITTVMSLLPRKSCDVKKIMSLSKKALAKRVKEKEEGKRIQLNVQVDSDTMTKLKELEATSKNKEKRFDIVMQAVKLLHRLRMRPRPSRSPSKSLGVKPNQIDSISADKKQDSNSRKKNSSRRSPPWKNKSRPSDNAIEDTSNASASLDSTNENGASAAPPEVPQSHQPPTSAELPASDVVENEGKGGDTPNPKSDTSAALQELNKNLG
ncbi:hypothetical protein [Aeromonas salmonicida]|uniref:hypothetical protein n=1 Tax=Aeromonas salmonicida TaxID=645 RepID=UPI0039A6E5AA